nr:endonuclease/exonuclease/phosphatase family protein [Ipomoea batatas]
MSAAMDRPREAATMKMGFPATPCFSRKPVRPTSSEARRKNNSNPEPAGAAWRRRGSNDDKATIFSVLLWNGGLDVEVVGYSNHYIDTLVSFGGSTLSGSERMGRHRRHHSWNFLRGTERWVQEKLDRILVSGDWRDVFGEARASSLEGSCSDHMPILLQLEHVRRRVGRRRIRYENSRGYYDECKRVVADTWDGMSGCSLVQRLNCCNAAAWRWGRRTFKGIEAEIDFCRKEMGRLRPVGGSGNGCDFSVVQRRYFALLNIQSD